MEQFKVQLTPPTCDFYLNPISIHIKSDMALITQISIVDTVV